MKRVKPARSTEASPIAERLAILLEVFSPWEGISLSYRQFAAELGPPVTEAAVKKWPHRRKFPADAARRIVARARERGLVGVTLEWVLWGEGPRPQKAATSETGASIGAPGRGRGSAAPEEPHGGYAALIADALQADLSHNEFGQWSSVEVQRTVLWALKDLARRLWVLQFDMGRTFKLTDEWAGRIGLPVRQAESGPGEETTD